MADPLLRVENLVRRFGGIRATDNLSLEVAKGELVTAGTKTRTAGARRTGWGTTDGRAEAWPLPASAASGARTAGAQQPAEAAFRPTSGSQQSWAPRASAPRGPQRHGPASPATRVASRTRTAEPRATPVMTPWNYSLTPKSMDNGAH